MIDSVYTDGGVVLKNPSDIGGTWAYCYVNEGGLVSEASGYFLPGDLGMKQFTNNFTELLAALLAMEGLPDNWCGTIYTDSFVTKCRIELETVKFNGIPYPIQARVRYTRRRLGGYKVVLLGGHPSKADIVAGYRKKDNLPVSVFNKRCDDLRRIRAKECVDGVPQLVTS